MKNSPGLRSCLIAGLLAIAGPAPGAPPVTRDLAGTLSTVAADSLVAPLRELESRSPGPAGARVVMLLGRLHLSRGEYREAVDAFGRAAARLDPANKAEARYWMGIAWLGAGQPAQARSVLEEMTREPSPWRAPGLVAFARTWELHRRPDRALEALDEARLGCLEGDVHRRRSGRGFHGRKLVGTQCENRLDGVSKLANVARPWSESKTRQRPIVERVVDAVLERAFLQEVIDEQRNVVEAFAQRWEADARDGEHVIEVVPEDAAPDLSVEVAARRGDQTDVDEGPLGGADRRRLVMFEHAQEPPL